MWHLNLRPLQEERDVTTMTESVRVLSGFRGTQGLFRDVLWRPGLHSHDEICSWNHIRSRFQVSHWELGGEEGSGLWEAWSSVM
jgi:hypothetical protein